MNLLVRRRVLWDYVGGALWVLPAVSVVLFLAIGAILSRVAVEADSPLWPLAFQGTAEDARGILVVVSATMITVTGLVFALTIVALQIAAGQYSPRLLRNFMRDRGTQVVLSVFVGAFAYSTAGLHTVGVQRSSGEAFVPRLAVSGSLVLGLASVGVLIYFIHHLAHSIQIDTIMSTVQREARWTIRDLYPDQSGYLEPEERCPDPPALAVVVPAGRSGYIQAVQPEFLIRAARNHDLVVRLARQVGDHVVQGTPLAWTWRRTPDQPAADPALLQAAMGDAVSIGFERTMVQDVAFGLRRLVDIGNKALSPAVNGPLHRDPSRASPVGAVVPAGRPAPWRPTLPRRTGDAACGRAAANLRRLPAARHRPDPPVRGQGAGGDPQPHPAPQGCWRQRAERGPAPRLRPAHLAGAGGRQARDRPARRRGDGARGRSFRAWRAGSRPPPTNRRLSRGALQTSYG